MKREELMEFIRDQVPDADFELLEHAYDFAEHAHAGQLRKSGDPYFEHPKATAYRLAAFRMDDKTIAAGLLHDVPEDTEYTLKDVKKEFGSEVASLVEGVTKLGKLKYRGIQRYVENQRRVALESLEIYAPIANRLGMGDVKGQLEDLAFPYVYPEEYNWLIKKIEVERRQRDKIVTKLREVVEEALDQ